MKILTRNINLSRDKRSGEGFVRFEAEEDEDMYHLYNLIFIGDTVEAMTIRNVITESKSGVRDKSRIQTKICIEVVKIEFDAEQCALRLNGVNVKENEHIKMGQHHTLEIEIGRAFTITKSYWDSMNLELLDEICDPMRKAEIAAVVMQEGLAHLCLIKAAMTKTCARIERTIPKKEFGNAAYEKAIEKFFSDIYQALNKYINFDLIKVVLVGSPGFFNQDFMNYVNERAVKEDHDTCHHSAIYHNRSKFLKVGTSSGYKSAVEEVLSKPEVLQQLEHVKAVGEVRALQTFKDVFSRDPDRACYGFDDVQKASSMCAIENLLISDKMYRAENFDERKRYIQLVEEVRDNGGQVFKFSSMHVSGEELNNFTGIAATLRFPIVEVEEERLQSRSNSEDQSEVKKTISAFDIGDFL